MILVENGLKRSSFLHTFLVWVQLIPPNEVHCLVCLQISDKTRAHFSCDLVTANQKHCREIRVNLTIMIFYRFS